MSETARSNDLLKVEAWRRLVNGEFLKDLLLARKNGRIDLGGLQLPEQKILERGQTPGAEIRRIVPNASFYGVELQNVDLTGGGLLSIYFSDCL